MGKWWGHIPANIKGHNHTVGVNQSVTQILGDVWRDLAK